MWLRLLSSAPYCAFSGRMASMNCPDATCTDQKQVGTWLSSLAVFLLTPDVILQCWMCGFGKGACPIADRASSS